jgi:putative membrane protein
MTLQKTAASAGLAVGLATAGWGIAATSGTAAAGASTTAANVGLAAIRTTKPVSSQDRMFMDQASQINLTEISLGRYMQAHATTTVAKNLGGIYARDHTAAQASLRGLGLRLHVTRPAKPGVQLESMVARVEAQKGRNRDLAFAKASVSGHQTAIAIFRKEESAGSNPAVKAYAARYLPALQAHLRLAEHAESVLRATLTK